MRTIGFAFLVLIFISTDIDLCCANVATHLNRISLEERQILEKFFRILLCREEFGYTLFGLKPVSVTHWSEDYGFIQSSLGCGSIESSRLYEGLKVWNKVKHHFPIQKYHLYDRAFVLDGVTYRELIFVNNKELLATKEKYPKLLKDFQISDLTSDIQNCDACHHEKMGLLLGYGALNAKIFQKLSDIYLEVSCLPIAPIALSPSLNKMDPERVESLKYDRRDRSLKRNQKEVCDDFDSINAISFGVFSLPKEERVLCSVSVPSFNVDLQSDETEVLQKEYCQCHRRIIALSKETKFLESVLKILCEESCEP